jgi:hypothetical protein
VDPITDTYKEMAMTKYTIMLLGVTSLFLLACSTQHAVEVAPVEIKPIHITIDVNIRVDKALDDFFADIDDDPGESITTPPGDGE